MRVDKVCNIYIESELWAPESVNFIKPDGSAIEDKTAVGIEAKKGQQTVWVWRTLSPSSKLYSLIKEDAAKPHMTTSNNVTSSGKKLLVVVSSSPSKRTRTYMCVKSSNCNWVFQVTSCGRERVSWRQFLVPTGEDFTVAQLNIINDL